MHPATDVSQFPPAVMAVELPSGKAADGSPLVVHVRRITILQFMEATGFIPTIAGEPDDEDLTPEARFERRIENDRASRGPIRRICQAGIVSPTFAFDGEEGYSFDALVDVNRLAIYNAIMEFSGLSEGPGDADTKSVPPGSKGAGGAGNADGRAGGGDVGAGAESPAP